MNERWGVSALLGVLAVLSVCGSQAAECDDFPATMESAALGDAGAQHLVGRAYTFGRCVEQDHQEGAYWYFLAEGNGSREASYSIALAFKRGVALPRNPKLAEYFLERAADGGHQMSLVALANSKILEFSGCQDISTIDELVSRITEESRLALVERDRLEDLRRACVLQAP